ncbi:MAG: RDD family protein [Bacteroidetes bacterium]|nr:RDD family protein [Bacteroidota bacterium]
MAFWSVYLVMRFGGTPGKLILGIRIVDKEGNYLALAPALFRISPGIIITVFHMLGYKLLIDNFPGFSGEPSFLEFGKAIDEYGGSPMKIAMYLGYFVYLDVAVVLFNEKKRAIHDYLASSYVVTKCSLLSAKAV